MAPEDTDLVHLGEEAENQLVKFSDDDFAAAASSGSYFPRLQLMTSNSKQCKNGEFPINHFALVVDQTFTDLGDEVDILVLSWRPKAIDIGDEIISVFDPNADEFKRIQQEAENPNSGCMFGPEYLVYIPQVEKFATFFMGSKTMRREAPNVKARIKKAGTLKAGKIENKKYTWFSPQIVPCSTPFDPPAQDKLLEAVESFNNPTSSNTEKVEESEERAR